MATKSKRTASAKSGKKSAKTKPKKTAAAKVSARQPKVRKRVVAKPAVPAADVVKPRRAVFIDVENTSSENEILKVFEHLQINQSFQPTEVTGIGNWKALGSRFARTLGRYGAQLLHTAPPSGVRDWSDLWIAVNVGMWLARATPGDLLEIVSDDRAFDAIADAAAGAGVIFNRISYRGLPNPRGRDPEPSEPPRRPRRRRKGRGGAPVDAGAPKPQVQVHVAREADVEDDGHSASHEHIRTTLQRLVRGSGGWVNLDALANSLRAEGFVRPPGSPRLLTRLRRMKDVELLPNGMLRLVDEPQES